MKLKRIILTAVAGITTLGIGLAAVFCTAATTGAFSILLSEGDTAEKKELVIVQTMDDPPTAIVTEPTHADTDTEAEKEVPDEHYAAGSFYLNTEKVPKEFRDIDYLEIVTHDWAKSREDGTMGVRIPPKGWIVTKKQLDISRIAINAKEIAFQTETVGGVSYRFTGQYHHVDYCETDGETPDLIGRLIKIKDGKWAASMKAEFYVQCGC